MLAYDPSGGTTTLWLLACRTVYELDLKTLIWTRGDRFPREELESRLRCPSCGQMQVQVLWDVPNQPRKNAATGE